MKVSPLFSQSIDTLIYDSLATVEFKADTNQLYGFDEFINYKIPEYYQHIPTQSGKIYHVHWKSIESGKTDVVNVEIKGLIKGFKHRKISFETSTGEKVKSTKTNSEAIYKLELKGLEARSKKGKTYSLLAYYKQKGKSYLVGKLNIKSYNQIKKNIAIVPVNGADINKKELEKYINSVFKQAVAKIKITEFPLTIPQDSLNFTALTEFEDHKQRLEIFRRHIKATGIDTPKADYVLFLFEKPANTALQSVTYNNQPYGIFYLEKGTKEKVFRDLTQTAAHGCFKLKHTWEMGVGSQDGTDNLMDYKGGTDLYVYQWHNIHDPAGGLGWFQDAEQGKSTTIYIVSTLDYQTVPVPDEYKTGDYLTFVSPAGLPISVPKSATGFGFQSDKFFNLNLQEADKQGGITVAPEALTNFTYDGKKYGAVIVGEDFIGYYPNSSTSGKAFNDKHSVGKTTFEILAHDNGSIKKADCDFDKVKANEKGKYLSNGPYKEKLGLPCIGGGDYNLAVKSIADKLKILIKTGTYADVGIGFTGNQEKVFDDKFKVYFNNTQKQIFLIQSQISIELGESKKEEFLKDVLSQCGDFDPNNMMFICMPCYFDNSMQANKVEPLAKLTAVAGFFKTKDFNLELNTTNFNKIANEIYKGIPKPYYLIPYKLSYKGEVIELKPEINQNVTGKSIIYDFRLNVDSRIDEYIELLDAAEWLRPRVGTVAAVTNIESYPKALKKVDEFEQNSVPGEDGSINHGLFESTLVPNSEGYSSKANQFAQWYRDYKFDGVKYRGGSISKDDAESPDDGDFVIGQNIVEYEGNLEALDELGLVLAPFSLDLITDIAGAIYSGYYHDHERTAIYSAGVMIPFGTGGMLKLSKESLEQLAEGTLKLIRQGDGYKLVKLIGDLDPFIYGQLKKFTSDESLIATLHGNILKSNLPNGHVTDKLAELLVKAGSSNNVSVLAKLDGWEKIVVGKNNDNLLEKFLTDLEKTDYSNFVYDFARMPERLDIYKTIREYPENAWDYIKKFDQDDDLYKWGKGKFFNANCQLGKEFEVDMVDELLDRVNRTINKNSDLYKKLKAKIPDLDDRKVLTQVQFCLPGLEYPCNGSGEYFIADMVFVKYDSRKRITDVIISETKLSKGTALSEGQELARNNLGQNLYIRSTTREFDEVADKLPSNLIQNQTILTKDFVKIYGDGTGKFLGVE